MNSLIRQKKNKLCDIVILVKKMKVKIFDESHEKDLEAQVNNFLSTLSGDVIDIKFSTAISMFGEDQIYCFTAMIIYTS